MSYEDHIQSSHFDNDKNIDLNSIKIIVDKHLPSKYRSDYLKILNDVYVPKKRKIEILSLIKKILKDNNDA